MMRNPITELPDHTPGILRLMRLKEACCGILPNRNWRSDLFPTRASSTTVNTHQHLRECFLSHESKVAVAVKTLSRPCIEQGAFAFAASLTTIEWHFMLLPLIPASSDSLICSSVQTYQLGENRPCQPRETSAETRFSVDFALETDARERQNGFDVDQPKLT